MATLQSANDELFPSFLSEDFEPVRKLTNRGAAEIYLAISTRGRLRGRHVVLKKVARTDAETMSSPLLHQSLCHPNIVALHAIISVDVSDFDFHVLEFCSEGSLLSLLQTRTPASLNDAEIRVVLKGIVGALIYLKEKRIVHGCIGTSNILLGHGFKPKLSDFQRAKMLQDDPKLETRRPKPVINDLAMLGRPTLLDFSIDTWGLGCVLHECMGGIDIETISLKAGHVARAFCKYPEQLRDLLLCLLKPDSDARLSIENVLKHNYFSDASATKSHLSSQILDKENNPEPLPSESLAVQTHGSAHEGSSRCGDSTACSTNYSRRRLALKDIGNVPLPRFLRASPIINAQKDVLHQTLPVSDNPSIMVPNEHNMETYVTTKARQQEGSKQEHVPMLAREISPYNIPIGTTRPLPIDTSSLTPKMHKLATGTITVLKSRSLLVDFRQNQRRLGLKGDQVMLISGQGSSVQIFDAPHLSVPSCLLEPLHHYNLDSLPSLYWKQYNDAANFIDRLKRKIPRIVMHEAGAKCSLMSNSPLADIEVILFSEQSDLVPTGSAQHDTDMQAVMRIQFSRRRHFLELAQKLTGNLGVEWKKECKPCLGSHDITALLTGNGINSLAKKGLKLVLKLLQTFEQMEGSVDGGNGSNTALGSNLFITKELGVLGKAETPNTSGQGLLSETRYLPSIGWCKRYPKADDYIYMILFCDGASLLLDVTSDSGLFSSPSGNQLNFKGLHTSSHQPEIENRVCFFARFIALYDDSKRV